MWLIHLDLEACVSASHHDGSSLSLCFQDVALQIFWCSQWSGTWAAIGRAAETALLHDFHHILLYQPYNTPHTALVTGSKTHNRNTRLNEHTSTWLFNAMLTLMLFLGVTGRGVVSNSSCFRRAAASKTIKHLNTVRFQWMLKDFSKEAEMQFFWPSELSVTSPLRLRESSPATLGAP